MTDYVKITDYAAKDNLLSGNPAKIVKGIEIGAEFDAIVTAIASKADEDGATLTNATLTQPTITLKQSASPTPTSEGDLQWDTDGDFIVVGNGASQTAIPSASSTHTLTNKSISLASNTITGTKAEFDSACSDGNFLFVGDISGLSDGDKGDVTVSASGATWTIDNNAVTYAKMQDVSATSRIIGRKTAAAGDPEECTLSEILDFIGSAAQGDILYRDASSWARLAAGTSGHYLKTQGAGANPLWAAVAAGGTPPTVQTFTGNGTWTKPANCQAVLFLAWGGGGAGGGSNSNTVDYGSGTGGSGGAFNAVLQTSPADTYSITIGNGGTGATGTNNQLTAANAGSSTTVGAILTAAGGAGGINNGGPLTAIVSSRAPGTQGGSSRGQGGVAVISDSTTNGNSASANTGGGGSGGVKVSTSGSSTGGSGGSGYVIAVEFY